MKLFDDYTQQIQYNEMISLLIGAQTYRIITLAFLWGMTQGIFEPAFAILAGAGGILIGVTAIPFGIFLWRGYSWSKYGVVVWSVLGIAELFNAVTLGFIPNPNFGTSTLTTFPWILIPTLAVSTALTLHGIMLYQLRSWIPKQETIRLG